MSKYEPSPTEMVRWIETQLHSGVKKIFLYDMIGSKNLSTVFMYYRELRVLEVLNFPLPKYWTDFMGNTRPLSDMQAESIPVLDCRGRAAGYTYVLCLDLDQVLAPRSSDKLDDFFQESLRERPKAAGFYIDVDWSLTNPIAGETSRMRWINDKPSWEATMFMFMPDRVYTPNLYSMQALPGYSTYKVSKVDASLRHCPSAVWHKCFPEPKTRNRFRTLNYQIHKVLDLL
jgi:hypothetical protein